MASIALWVVVAVVAWFVLKAVIGTIFWLLRAVVVLAVIAGLVWFFARKRFD